MRSFRAMARGPSDDPLARPLFGGDLDAAAAFAEGLQDAVEEIEEILDALRVVSNAGVVAWSPV